MPRVVGACQVPAEPPFAPGRSNKQINHFCRAHALLGQRRERRPKSPPTSSSPLPSKKSKKGTLKAFWGVKGHRLGWSL